MPKCLLLSQCERSCFIRNYTIHVWRPEDFFGPRFMKQSAYFVEEAEEYMTECHPISSSNRTLKQCHHARLDLFGEDKTEFLFSVNNGTAATGCSRTLPPLRLDAPTGLPNPGSIGHVFSIYDGLLPTYSNLRVSVFSFLFSNTQESCVSLY